MDDLHIAEIMTTSVAVVAQDAPLLDVVEALRSGGASCAVVCEGQIPGGIVTVADLIPPLQAAVRGENIRDLTALDVMSFPPFTLHATELMSDAMALVVQRGVSSVPVVNERGELTGLIRLRQLLSAHAEQLDAKRESLEQLVAARTEELLSSNVQLREISLIDPLTQVGNRRAMMIRLQEIHEAARRFGTSYSVLMIDLDLFKKFNDLCGHLEGDSILRETVKAILDALRKIDQIYRYGGEEFIVVLPQTSLKGAREAAERVRASIEKRGLPHPGSPHQVVTVSCGVATAIGEEGVADDWSSVISDADAALYRAKGLGRNLISI